MSADGNWTINMDTPIGARSLDLAITTSGDTFTGKINSEMGAREIAGRIAGDTLTWSMDITKPMPITLGFTVTINGDRMTGNCKLGPFGDAAVAGERR